MLKLENIFHLEIQNVAGKVDKDFLAFLNAF